ncbi:MAG: hypothetical protein ACTSPI_00080 [Candidatus Heimdallarchaeaceae archaeon]
MDAKERLFLNFNFVKGAQKFLKEAGLLKYAMDENEELDANAVAQAMAEEGMEIPAEESVEENAVLEVANTLIEMAEQADPATAAKLEEAAGTVVEAVSGEGEVEEAAKEVVTEEVSEPVVEKVEEAKKEASKIAKEIKESMEAPEAKLEHTEEGEIHKTDYNKGLGKTTVNTEKGEIGAEENVESNVVKTVAPEANLKHTDEGEIHKTDYNKGLGETTLNTEKGEIGAKENVQPKMEPKNAEEKVTEKVAKELAFTAMQAVLAKTLGK